MELVSGVVSERIQNGAVVGMRENDKIRDHRVNTDSTSAASVTDTYTPEEKRESIGLYHPDKDSDGKSVILFDAPKDEAGMSVKASEPVINYTQPKETEKEKDPGQAAPNVSKSKPEICRGNTDRVDRKIEELKKKKTDLERQLSSETDETKIRALTQKLAQVERELSQKDNDSYRRQHTVFS